MKRLILTLIFLVVSTNANSLYDKEFKLVFGDKPCEKTLKKYIFVGCPYNDFLKGEAMKFDDKRTLEFGSVHRNKCLKLFAERKNCVLKHTMARKTFDDDILLRHKSLKIIERYCN